MTLSDIIEGWKLMLELFVVVGLPIFGFLAVFIIVMMYLSCIYNWGEMHLPFCSSSGPYN